MPVAQPHRELFAVADEELGERERDRRACRRGTRPRARSSRRGAARCGRGSSTARKSRNEIRNVAMTIDHERDAVLQLRADVRAGQAAVDREALSHPAPPASGCRGRARRVRARAAPPPRPPAPRAPTRGRARVLAEVDVDRHLDDRARTAARARTSRASVGKNASGSVMPEKKRHAVTERRRTPRWSTIQKAATL